MRKILHADESGDFSLATRSVREFIKLPIAESYRVASQRDRRTDVNGKFGKIAGSIDPASFGPTGVDLLTGDASKAREK